MLISTSVDQTQFRRWIVTLALGGLLVAGAERLGAQEDVQDTIADALQELQQPPPPGPGATSQPAPAVPPRESAPGPPGTQLPPVVPPARTTPGGVAARPQPPSQSPFRLARAQLRRAPSMFGNFFAPPLVIELPDSETNGMRGPATAELPRGGALRRTKISDNGATLPTDRVYFLYNHYANALDQLALDPTGNFLGPNSRESVDRYTAGFERTFFYGGGSVELRVPFSSPNDLDLRPQFDTAIIAPGQEFGNMNVAFKALVTEYADFASAIGLAVDIPTGEDVDATIDSFPPGSQFPGDLFTFHIENETVYLQPFVAALMTPSDRTFIQGFILVDVPVGGDTVTITDPAVGTTNVGRLEDPTLLHVDVAFGRWFIQDAPGLVRGLAGVVEFHSSPMVSDPGVVDASRGGLPITFGNSQRLEYVDLTVGLHAQLGDDTTLRVGGVFPLRDRPDRTFDAELLVQVNRFLR